MSKPVYVVIEHLRVMGVPERRLRACSHDPLGASQILEAIEAARPRGGRRVALTIHILEPGVIYNDARSIPLIDPSADPAGRSEPAGRGPASDSPRPPARPNPSSPNLTLARVSHPLAASAEASLAQARFEDEFGAQLDAASEAARAIRQPLRPDPSPREPPLSQPDDEFKGTGDPQR